MVIYCFTMAENGVTTCEKPQIVLYYMYIVYGFCKLDTLFCTIKHFAELHMGMGEVYE